MRIGILLVVAAAATAVLQVQAAEINVGGETTWRVPSDPNFYSSWATRRSFTVGDILVFRFAADSHGVAGVTKEAYDNCDTKNANFVNRTTPFRFTLDHNLQNYYFICTVHAHCAAGQKLAITHLKRPSSASTTPPPPPPSSASTSTLPFISLPVALIIAYVTVIVPLLP